MSGDKLHASGMPIKETGVRKARLRMPLAAALLALLSLCSMAGTEREAAGTVSIPVARVHMTAQEQAAFAGAQTGRRLRERREKSLALLDSVIEDGDTAKETRQNALAQKAQIALCMEREARTEAALDAMGIAAAQVVCGGEDVFVFVPADTAAKEKERVRIIDAAVSHTGAAAESVKIILAKK